MRTRRAAFLDRDGCVIEEVDFLTRAEQLRLEPGAADAMRRLRDAGYALVLITNQSGVARGMLTEDELCGIHGHLESMLAGAGVTLSAIYYCPHLPGAPAKEYDQVCSCRKPEPGSILRAAKDHDLDLAASIMIGDSERDVEAGRRAGCRTVLLHHGSPPETTAADWTARDLAEAVERLLR